MSIWDRLSTPPYTKREQRIGGWLDAGLAVLTAAVLGLVVWWIL